MIFPSTRLFLRPTIADPLVPVNVLWEMMLSSWRPMPHLPSPVKTIFFHSSVQAVVNVGGLQVPVRRGGLDVGGTLKLHEAVPAVVGVAPAGSAAWRSVSNCLMDFSLCGMPMNDHDFTRRWKSGTCLVAARSALGLANSSWRKGQAPEIGCLSLSSGMS